MVVSCCVINCTSRYNKKNDQGFYRFPKKPLERRHLWTAAVHRETIDGKKWEPSDHDRVCYKHFISGKKSNDKQNPDYVPSLHLGYSTISSTPADEKLDRYHRYKTREDTKELNVIQEIIKENDQFEQALKSEASAPNSDIHDNCLKAISSLRQEKDQLMKELARLQSENSVLSNELNHVKFGEGLVTTDKKTLFYTGIPTVKAFQWLLSLCLLFLPKSKSLSPTSVLLCILVKLRLNLSHQDLAYRLNVSVATVSEILNKGIPQVARRLAFLIQWPKRENLIKNLPLAFKSSYRKCVSIIDCFEVFVQRAGQLSVRAQTWSNYKHHNTIKFLVSITPTGAISFVSRAFGGRTSDKIITQRSGYLDMLEPGDCVLADRGFLISEELASRHAHLVIPAFTRGKSQLSASDVEQTRRIARVRIHVERAIERIKNFNILNSSMSIHLVPQADNVLTIIAAICNLQPKLVS